MKRAGAVGQPRWGPRQRLCPLLHPDGQLGSGCPHGPTGLAHVDHQELGSLESRRGEVPPGHRCLHKPSRGLAPHSNGLQSSVQQSDKLRKLRSRLRGQSPPGPAGSFPSPPATHPVTRMTMSPACPPWPLVLHVLHREEKDLGFITGRQESQKLKKKKHLGLKVQKKEIQGGPLLDSSGTASPRQVGSDMNKLPR